MQPRPQRQGQGGKKLFCCCGRRPISPEDEDRIAHYFRKMDPHNTGFVTWKQFKKVHKEEYYNKKYIIPFQSAHFMTEEEAKRIFQGVDRDNDERFTLEELRREANKYIAIETGVPQMATAHPYF